MITGRDTLQEINDHVLQAQSQIENADREMERPDIALEQAAHRGGGSVPATGQVPPRRDERRP